MTVLQGLDRFARIRTAAAEAMTELAAAVTELDALSVTSCAQAATLLNALHQNQGRLHQASFRLLVLGDVKRGKSTFLNALLGETLLPSDVNPCTALLTIIRYGPHPQVTLNFTDGRPAEIIDVSAFQQHYTLSTTVPRNASPVFSNITQAVIEYPLPLLKMGIEIVDSPGLNDTEALDQQSLAYLQNCHAVLFVMRAIQPCTLTEQRYIHTHLQGKGITTFFLLNGWDQVRESLLDPDDSVAVAAAESKLHQVFRSSLQSYCSAEPGFEADYDERVFPVSALQALRQRLLDSNLSGTGFPKFLSALNTFLIQKRAVATLQPTQVLANQTVAFSQGISAEHLSSCDQEMTALKQQILGAAPEFERLANLRAVFETAAKQTQDRNAVRLADAIKHDLTQRSGTFDHDFQRYQPLHSLTDQLNPAAREILNTQLEQAFQRYLSDAVEQWKAVWLPQLKAAFLDLAQPVGPYGQGHRTYAHQALAAISVPTSPGLGLSELDWIDWINDLFLPKESVEKTARDACAQQLPQIAATLWTLTYQAVKANFERYTAQVVERIDMDLSSQQNRLQQQLAQQTALKDRCDRTRHKLDRLQAQVAEMNSHLQAQIADLIACPPIENSGQTNKS